MPNNIYRNSEGYYDPTAGAALAKCDRKEKSDRRKAIRKSNAKARKQAASEYRSIVYICSRYAGDIANNVIAAQRYCRFAVDSGYIPFLALIEKDGGAVTTSETLSASDIFMAPIIVAMMSSQCASDNSGQLRFSIASALVVPLATSLLTVFKNISLFRFPPGISHLLIP